MVDPLRHKEKTANKSTDASRLKDEPASGKFKKRGVASSKPGPLKRLAALFRSETSSHLDKAAICSTTSPQAIQKHLTKILQDSTPQINPKLLSPELLQLDLYEFKNHLQKIVNKPPSNLTEVGQKKLNQLKYIMEVATHMEADQWRSSYAQGLLMKYLLLDNAVGHLFPKELKGTEEQIKVGELYDESGTKFDNLRGDRSPVAQAIPIITANGGSWDTIKEYTSEQAAISWGITPVAFKLLIAQEGRADNPENYFWGVADTYQDHINNDYTLSIITPEFKESMQFMHAFNMLFLSKVDMPGNQRSEHKMTLYRRETSPNGKQVVMDRVRGAAESFSIGFASKNFGPYEIKKDIAHHNIFCSYICNSRWESLLMTDTEREFIAFSNSAETIITDEPKAQDDVTR